MTVSKKMAKNGSLTIPKSTRLKLNWKAETSLDLIEQEDGTLLIRGTARPAVSAEHIRTSENSKTCTSAKNVQMK